MRRTREGRCDPMAPVLVSAALLAGGIAAAVAAAAVRFAPEEPPRIASVRLGELTAVYATEAAGRDAAPEDVRAWGTALERALAHVAERRGAVLLPARAVAAGAPDVTDEVRAALAAFLDEPARAAGAEPGR